MTLLEQVHDECPVCKHARAEIERPRAAFKENCYCPRPANAAPPGELTVGQCMARGECGCIYARYFAR